MISTPAATALAAAYTPAYTTPAYHTGQIEWHARCVCEAIVLWRQQQNEKPTPRCGCQEVGG